MTLEVSEVDLPERSHSADAGSLRAQKHHIRLLAVSLGAVVAGAAVSLFPTDGWFPRPLQAGGVAACFLASAVLGIVTKTLGFEERWYRARAVAESVKSLAWKYMMRAKPFALPSGSGHQVEGRFLERVQEVARSLHGALPADPGEAVQITEAMRRVRDAQWQERLTLYNRDRLGDQFSWYTRKANWNRSRDQSWTIGVLVGQILIVFLIGALWANSMGVQMVAAMATVVASAMAWAQLKRFRELRVAYEVAARELETLRGRAAQVTDDASLALFVQEVESAISREHTLWVARRTT